MTALERHHDHDRALELAAMAIDFELTSAESAELEDQMAACPSCSRAAAAMRADAGSHACSVDPAALAPRRRRRLRRDRRPAGGTAARAAAGGRDAPVARPARRPGRRRVAARQRSVADHRRPDESSGVGHAGPGLVAAAGARRRRGMADVAAFRRFERWSPHRGCHDRGHGARRRGAWRLLPGRAGPDRLLRRGLDRRRGLVVERRRRPPWLAGRPGLPGERTGEGALRRRFRTERARRHRIPLRRGQRRTSRDLAVGRRTGVGARGGHVRSGRARRASQRDHGE